MIVDLFIGICMLSTRVCIPEISMPNVAFDSIDTCGKYVQAQIDAKHDDDKPAMLGDIGLTFRCAVRS